MVQNDNFSFVNLHDFENNGDTWFQDTFGDLKWCTHWSNTPILREGCKHLSLGFRGCLFHLQSERYSSSNSNSKLTSYVEKMFKKLSVAVVILSGSNSGQSGNFKLCTLVLVARFIRKRVSGKLCDYEFENGWILLKCNVSLTYWIRNLLMSWKWLDISN